MEEFIKDYCANEYEDEAEYAIEYFLESLEEMELEKNGIKKKWI